MSKLRRDRLNAAHQAEICLFHYICSLGLLVDRVAGKMGGEFEVELVEKVAVGLSGLGML